MLFNMLIAFVFCFIIALLAMNPKANKSGDIPAKAEFIITLSWPDMDPNDIDLWVQGPSGESVWFRNREADLMHLDRDDRGTSNNTILINGKKVVNHLGSTRQRSHHGSLHRHTRRWHGQHQHHS